jgi:dimethylglycine dehydrogenase
MESGLGRFVKLDKEFIGKAPLASMLQKGPRRSFVTLRVDSRKAPAHGGDSILHNGRVVGTVCSAAWGHRVGRNLAMAFVEPGHAHDGSQLAIQILGEQVAAIVSDDCQYDQSFSRLRA